MAARTDRALVCAALAGVVVAGAAGCKPVYDADVAGIVFSEEEWAKLQAHRWQGDPPDDPTNDHDTNKPLAAELGQKLFFDTGYWGSRVGDRQAKSCADAVCHDPDQWFQSVTVDPQNAFPFRNSPTLVDVAFYEWYAWDGSRDSLWSQNLFPPEAPMKSDRATVVRRMLQAYGDEYLAVFGPPLLEPDDPALQEPATPIRRNDAQGKQLPKDAANYRWDGLTEAQWHAINEMYANFGKALAAYERKLVSQESPFDRFLDGDDDAMSAEAKRGLRLFELELPCAECHAGPTFSDDEFHNIGLGDATRNGEGRYHAIGVWEGDEFNEPGVYGDDERPDFQAPSEDEADKGKFRTKHLRQVAETGRYMHDGSLETLQDVLRYYGDLQPGVGGLGELDEALHDMADFELTKADRDDLEAFLESLTGDPIPDDLRQDTSAKAP